MEINKNLPLRRGVTGESIPLKLILFLILTERGPDCNGGKDFLTDTKTITKALTDRKMALLSLILSLPPIRKKQSIHPPGITGVQ